MPSLPLTPKSSADRNYSLFPPQENCFNTLQFCALLKKQHHFKQKNIIRNFATKFQPSSITQQTDKEQLCKLLLTMKHRALLTVCLRQQAQRSQNWNAVNSSCSWPKGWAPSTDYQCFWQGFIIICETAGYQDRAWLFPCFCSPLRLSFPRYTNGVLPLWAGTAGLSHATSRLCSHPSPSQLLGPLGCEHSWPSQTTPASHLWSWSPPKNGSLSTTGFWNSRTGRRDIIVCRNGHNLRASPLNQNCQTAFCTVRHLWLSSHCFHSFHPNVRSTKHPRPTQLRGPPAAGWATRVQLPYWYNSANPRW